MIIQTAPAGKPRLAIMMHEHTALSGQFARAFGNDLFEAAQPDDLLFYVVSHHDEGWAEFDRDPVTDENTGLPYNLVETPAEYITVTSRRSPDFNERRHPYCGLLSSMHSWGLYNGRYGLSNLVLIDKIPLHDRPLAERMLDGEIIRQTRLKAEIASRAAGDGMARGKAPVPELQAASILRHARALFQPRASGRTRRAKIRTCAVERRTGHEHHDPSARPGCIRDVAISFRCEFRRIRLRRPLHRAAAGTRRLVVGAQGNTYSVGKLSSGCGMMAAFVAHLGNKRRRRLRYFPLLHFDVRCPH